MENFPANFVAGFLRLHNQYRVLHDAPPLQIGEELNEYAQEWANALAEKAILEYRPETKYGENLYRSTWKKTERELKPIDPLEEWYREGRYFKYGQEQPQSLEDVRHFTQMIWKESMMIGLGMAFDNEHIIYFVCNYDPPGNVEGKFAENVLPLKEEFNEDVIYFVCNYNTLGNVEGKFAENVLPLKEGGQELLQHEAEGIRIVEPRLEIVKSMERLYAVPSEKLRVWSIWLTKIGEIADEWQRWLRAHIDLIVRLSEHLQAAELAIGRSKMEIVQLKKVASKAEHVDEDQPLDETGDSARERESSIYEEAIDTSAAEEANGAIESPDNQLKQGASEHDIDELSETSETTLTAASSVTLTASKATVIEAPATASTEASKTTVIEAPGTASTSKTTVIEAPGTASTSKTTVTKATELTEASKSDETTGNGKKDPIMTWPIGSPWEHLGLEDPCDEEDFEKLPLPSNEQEMRELLKKFTHQATIYRSYYKHWQETASQATKEIGGRLVLATFRVQGKDETGRIKRPTRLKRCKVDQNVHVESKKESIKSNDEQFNASTPDPEVPIDENDKVSLGTSRPENPSSATVKERSQVRLNKESEKSIEVADWIRDCARAVEPIPYVFYVKAEPDIDIAIEHDDEEVILADLDREHVIARRKRIFFNLADKPCTGGKPWI